MIYFHLVGCRVVKNLGIYRLQGQILRPTRFFKNQFLIIRPSDELLQGVNKKNLPFPLTNVYTPLRPLSEAIFDRKFKISLLDHPLSREDFSLKIDVRDQTIWNCVLELYLFHPSQMKLKLAGLFFQKSTRWH